MLDSAVWMAYAEEVIRSLQQEIRKGEYNLHSVPDKIRLRTSWPPFARNARNAGGVRIAE